MLIQGWAPPRTPTAGQRPQPGDCNDSSRENVSLPAGGLRVGRRLLWAPVSCFARDADDWLNYAATSRATSSSDSGIGSRRRQVIWIGRSPRASTNVAGPSKLNGA